MKTDKATPRPWVVFENEENFSIAHNGPLAYVPKSLELNGKANAELIVRAVNSYNELLEACKEALGELSLTSKVYDHICEAIAKAEKGE